MGVVVKLDPDEVCLPEVRERIGQIGPWALWCCGKTVGLCGSLSKQGPRRSSERPVGGADFTLIV